MKHEKAQQLLGESSASFQEKLSTFWGKAAELFEVTRIRLYCIKKKGPYGEIRPFLFELFGMYVLPRN
jgi:hypothetical protein